MRIEDLQKTQEEQAMETKQEVLQAAIEKVRSMHCRTDAMSSSTVWGIQTASAHPSG